MGEAQMKQKLHRLIDEGDSRPLKLMYVLAKGYVEEDYTLPGKPMSGSTLKNRVRTARSRIKKGLFTMQQDLEREAKTW